MPLPPPVSLFNDVAAAAAAAAAATAAAELEPPFLRGRGRERELVVGEAGVVVGVSGGRGADADMLFMTGPEAGREFGGIDVRGMGRPPVEPMAEDGAVPVCAFAPAGFALGLVPLLLTDDSGPPPALPPLIP